MVKTKNVVVREKGSALQDGKIDEIIGITNEYKRNSSRQDYWQRRSCTGELRMEKKTLRNINVMGRRNKADAVYRPTRPCFLQGVEMMKILMTIVLFSGAALGQVMQNPNSSLFADYKASRVGDAVTVIVTEQNSASKDASTNTSRASTITLPVPAT